VTPVRAKCSAALMPAWLGSASTTLHGPAASLALRTLHGEINTVKCQLNGIAQKGVGGFERAIDGILAEYIAGDRGL